MKTAKMKRTAQDLIGKRVYVILGGKRKGCGLRLVRVSDVKTDRRGNTKSVSVRMFNVYTYRYNGRRVRLTRQELATLTVLWYRKEVPMREWLKGGAA